MAQRVAPARAGAQERGPEGWRPNSMSVAPGRRRDVSAVRAPAIAPALVVVVDLRELGVDDLLVARLAVAPGGAGARRGRRLLLLLVERLAELHRRLGQRLGLGLDRVGVAAVERGAGLGDRAFDLGLQRRVDLVAMLLELLLG